MSEIQVSPEHYEKLRYDNKKRFINYWHQINEITSINADSILEIGVGNGFVSNYLSGNNYNIKTLDIDARLNPDVVGSVLDLPFEDNKFDLITCFEVLEHLPYNKAEQAIKELYRVSSKNTIISVPNRTLCYKFLIKLPVIKEKSFLFSIPRLLSKKHIFDGQHYWELGKKGYPVSRFRKTIENQGFVISKSYRIFESDNHHIFVLKK